MDIQNMNCFKQTLIEKLSLLLFINSRNDKELKESKTTILLCEYLTKEEIIKLLEKEEEIIHLSKII